MFFSDLREYRLGGVFADVLGNVEVAEGAGTLGVHAPLRDHLAYEVAELFMQPHVLRQQRAARAGGEAVLVVGHRSAGLGSEMGGRGLVGRLDRKSVVSGKSVSVRVVPGGRRGIKKQKRNKHKN